jgi:hypothetical protein
VRGLAAELGVDLGRLGEIADRYPVINQYYDTTEDTEGTAANAGS